jgi:hypothetical protein
MAAALAAMVAAAKAVVPAFTADGPGESQAGEPFVILDVREKRIRKWKHCCPGPVVAATQLGYQSVAFMVDGFTAWSALRLPVIGQPL